MKKNLLRSLLSLTIVCLSLVLAVCPLVLCEESIHCGSLLRVETEQGTNVEGKLVYNEKSILILKGNKSGSQVVQLNEVRTAFSVKRKSGTGKLIGAVFGFALGLTGAQIINNNRNWDSKPRGLFDKESAEVGILLGMSIGGALVGGGVGSLIGHRIVSFHEIDVEAIPVCVSQTGELTPIEVRLAFRF